MADNDQDDAQKTEEPTHKRLTEAKKKGQLVTSREITSFFLLMVFALLIATLLPRLMKQAKFLLFPFIDHPDQLATGVQGISDVMREATLGSLSIMMVPLLFALGAVVVANYIQHGNVWTLDPMTPKLNRISPLAGWKRLFSLRSIVEFLKGIVKIIIVGIAIWYAVKADLNQIRMLPNHDVYAILLFLAKLSTNLMIAVCVAMFFIAAIDYMYQRFDYMKKMRMTKQEVKDEYKQQEGDPHVKQRLRQIRSERARKRMMSAVPQADVIITNPTHFSVALKYDNASMGAPTVIAKGIDHLALTIRKIAKENDIPIVQNPPLARALYDSVEIDAEIPADHYKAVAEIISYVYKLKGKMPIMRKAEARNRKPETGR